MLQFCCLITERDFWSVLLQLSLTGKITWSLDLNYGTMQLSLYVSLSVRGREKRRKAITILRVVQIVAILQYSLDCALAGWVTVFPE